MPATPGGGLGRGGRLPTPRLAGRRELPHSAALPDGIYPFKRNLGEGGGATKGGGLRSGIPSLRLLYPSPSLRLTLRLSSPSFPLFFFSFDTKVGL